MSWKSLTFDDLEANALWLEVGRWALDVAGAVGPTLATAGILVLLMQTSDDLICRKYWYIIFDIYVSHRDNENIIIFSIFLQYLL